MKGAVLQISILLLFVTGAGCEKENDPGEYIEKQFLKFSDFGCANVLLYFQSAHPGSYSIVTSQQKLEDYITSDCIPQLDFSRYIVLIGQRSFTTGVSLYDEKLEENNNEVVYTITFLTHISMVAQGIQYHVVIEKPTGEKDFRVVEIVKDRE